LCGFVFFYTVLAIVELYLMIKYIRLGPEKLFSSTDFSIQPISTLKRKTISNGSVGESHA
jgi:cytochrome d ubiquinol oxidase subunit I